MSSDGNSERPSNGFVFAATGEVYTVLARRAARTLRQVMPDAVIDLFTDQALADDVFDRIHALDRSGHRPKMEALRRSRFARTVYLDADVMVLADIAELFEVLDQCDIAAALGHDRRERMSPRDGVPRPFPVVNSGVMAVRASDAVAAFLRSWEAEVIETGATLDQPALRRRLYHSDLRFTALQVDYNLKDVTMIDGWQDQRGAPRILHQSRLHDGPPGDPTAPYSIDELLAPRRAAHLRALLASDWSLGGVPRELVPPTDQLRRALARKG